ncbi:WecB/TagA/CpsF family glycosyltransferase [Aureimonas sp. ME7]|uniref:WecB/TagA/CpsF family glycosyltransferase n=1 Tax=Aureimonas sp. ME7 TaxID=2744252 RepID=UPI0015F70DF4|nr:WecB/TagA/CpsF family glycosyltransferase [Aureimonas sp. ME7]
MTLAFDGVPLLRRASDRFLGVAFQRIVFNDIIEILETVDHDAKFRYVVTPNVDHVVRLSRQPELVDIYRGAWLTLCDSRPVRLAGWLFGRGIPVVTGSDLTATMFGRVMPHGSRVAVVAPSQLALDRLVERFPQFEIHGHVPPAGLGGKPEELARCAAFARDCRARFIFLAVGSPQSERIAWLMSRDPEARGTAFCIGASIEFITGLQRRAPRWMQRAGLEWLHRVASDPGRLWKRYAFSLAPFLGLMTREADRKAADAGWRPSPQTPLPVTRDRRSKAVVISRTGRRIDASKSRKGPQSAH